MATKNTRNARFLLSGTLGGPYTAVTKTHGLKFGIPTDFSEDTGHGQQFKSYVPGLQDFKLTLAAYYDTLYTTLQAMSLNKIAEYFLAYYDFADSLNYYRGQCFVGQDEDSLDIGKTAEQSYTAVIANSDLQVVRAGAAL